MALSTRIEGKSTLQSSRLRARQGLRTLRVRSMMDSDLKRPELKRPDTPAEPQKKLFSDAPAATSVSPATAAAPTAQHTTVSHSTSSTSGGVTIEYQRQRAKEMTRYFKELKLNELSVKSKVFGWTAANEISNGRWVMFGLLVGMMTEYATGVDFPHQIGLLLSYLGIVDTD